jgi:hypothetical protein
VKYYIYISDAKVDMLFPQVPHDIKKKVATEWKMDLKVLSASRKVETEGEDNRIARLETVVDFIQEYGKVGSVDDPDDYIADTLAMRWGMLTTTPENSLAFFAADTDQTTVGLGGSAQHLLGRNGGDEIRYNSLTPALLDCLFKELGWGADNFKGLGGTSERTAEIFLRAVHASAARMLGPKQSLEFLAKRLLYGTVEGVEIDPLETSDDTADRSVLLATPLYIALAD